MRVIGWLRFDLALGAPRFGATDRGHAGSRRGSRGHERFGRCLRLLRASVASTPGMPWLRMPGLGVAWLRSSRLGMPRLGLLRLGSSRFGMSRFGNSRLALTTLGMTRSALALLAAAA